MDIDNIGDRFKELVPKKLFSKLSNPKYFQIIPRISMDIDYFFEVPPKGFLKKILHDLKHTRLSFFAEHDQRQTESEIREWLWSKFNLRKNREDWKKVSAFCDLFSQCIRFKNGNRNYVELQYSDFRSEKCLIFKTKFEYYESKYFHDEDFAKRGTKGKLMPVIWVGKGWNQNKKHYKFAPGINCEISYSGIMSAKEWAIFRKSRSKRNHQEEFEDWYSKIEWD